MTREAVHPVDSIDHVAMLARRAPFTPDDAVLLAAVGATAERARGTASLDAADLGATAPGTTLMLAAGAATVRPRVSLELGRLEMLARAVPVDSRLTVLSFAEGLLAQSHPRQAWELICSVVGAKTAVAHALGLDVAAHLGAAEPWQPGVELPPVIERQLLADATARAAVAGTLHGLDDPRLSGLLADPVETAMTPAQARVLVVAGAAAEPGRAVEVAVHLLRHFPVHHLDESLRLVARIATRAGFAGQVAAQAHTEGFVAEQCTWAAAAATAGALNPDGVVQLAATLAPRIEDELDPGRELVAGLPLIEALLQIGAVDEAVGWAAHWQLPVPVLLRRCLHAGLGTGAALLATHPALGAVVESAPGPGDHEASGGARPWWEPQGADPAGRLGAARHMLAVVGQTPWPVVPASLADLLGFGP
ncbi:MAG: hypothetical protein ABI563_06120 [Specibacter sp.]